MLSLIFFIALDLAHGQDLVLHLITEIRNISEDIRTTGSSGATSAASGGLTTSGAVAVAVATFRVDATSVVAGTTTTTTTTTFALTGRITSSTLKNSNNNSSSSKTVHEDGCVVSRNAQEAPLTVSHTSLTDLPRHYPDTLSILPPHTPPLPNVGQPCCWQTKTPKKKKRPQRRSKRVGMKIRSQDNSLGFWQEMLRKAVGTVRGTVRAWRTATALQRETVLWQILLLQLVRTAKLLTSLVPPLKTQMTQPMVPPPGRCNPVHPQQKKPYMKVSIQCFPALTSFPMRNFQMEIKLQSLLPSESKADFTFLKIHHFS